MFTDLPKDHRDPVLIPATQAEADAVTWGCINGVHEHLQRPAEAKPVKKKRQLL